MFFFALILVKNLLDLSRDSIRTGFLVVYDEIETLGMILERNFDFCGDRSCLISACVACKNGSFILYYFIFLLL